MAEVIEIPIHLNFDHNKIIGMARLRKDALPKTPNWVLSLGFTVLEMKDGNITEYELVQLGLITDKDFRGYLNQTQEGREG